MNAVLTLAEQHGSTRVAAPARKVAEMARTSPADAHRVLIRLSGEGKWLRLAKRGNAQTGRANLYNLAPPLLNVWGASPPMSQDPPMSHPPMSHKEGPSPMSVALTAESPEALVEAIRLLAERSPETARQVLTEANSALPPLRIVGGDE